MGNCCGDGVRDKLDEPDFSSVDKKPMKNMVIENKQKKIKVYGNNFNSDTRTVLTLLDIS